MSIRTFMAGLAAACLATSPVVAAEVPRASQSADAESEMGGSSVILAVLAVAAIIAGIIIAVDGGDDSVSP